MPGLLAFLAILGGLFPISFGNGVEFTLCGIALLVSVRLYGLIWALPIALTCSFSSFHFFELQSYAFLIAIEIFIVGLLLRKGPIPLLAADAVFWVFFGAPLLYLFQLVSLPAETGVVLKPLLGIACTGIFNAIIASLFLKLPNIKAQTNKKINPARRVLALAQSCFLLPLIIVSTLSLLYAGTKDLSITIPFMDLVSQADAAGPEFWLQPGGAEAVEWKRSYLTLMLIMLLPYLLSFFIARQFTNKMIYPLKTLADQTDGLAEKISEGKDIDWPPLCTPLVDKLNINFKAITVAMREKIEELNEAKEQSNDALDSVLAERNWEVFSTGRKLRMEVNRRKRVQELLIDLESAESQYRFLMEKAMVGVFIIQEGMLTYANPKFSEIFGYSQAEILKIGDFLKLLHPEETERIELKHRNYLKGKDGNDQYELKALKRGGTEIFLEVYDGRTDFNGSPTIIGTLLDITPRKKAEETIKFLAYHDPLTTLPNRPLFRKQAEQALAFAERNNQLAALLFIDLDKFKTINDTLGHSVGDALLQQVATRLKDCIREVDAVSRFGGDEFNILLGQIKEESHSSLVAHKIVRSLQWPFKIEGNELYVTCSVGIAVYPKAGKDVDTLIANADTALYKAKELGRNNYQHYTEGLKTSALERMELENGLRKVLEKDELKVHYQPQVNLKTGKIIGMEALVRWDHSSGETIYPTTFITIAEETGLILPMGEHILRTACRQTVAWGKQGHESLRVGVNVSAHQFQDEGFLEMLEKAISDFGIEPSMLNIEITETVVMDDVKSNIEKLHRIHELGLTVSIDDFGIGYSSLSYLKDFPVDQLKIDRAFVQSLPEKEDDAKIARHIVDLAHSLGIAVIAEGVENQGQLNFLKEIDCDEIQGFIVSQPLPPSNFIELLQRKWIWGQPDSD